MARRWLVAAIVAGVMALLGARFVSGVRDTNQRTRENACRALNPDPVPAALAGREAPDFELADPTGRKVSLRSLRGRPILLNFWIANCPPCEKEAPSLEDLARQLEK